jgi:hypothetical protein
MVSMQVHRARHRLGLLIASAGGVHVGRNPLLPPLSYSAHGKTMTYRLRASGIKSSMPLKFTKASAALFA